MLNKAVIALSAILLLCNEIPFASGGKILIFLPLSSKSMANLFDPLTRGLIEQGHEIKLISPVKFKINSANLTQLQYFTADEIFNTYPEPFGLRRKASLFRFPLDLQQKYCHQMYQMEDVRNLANEKFDVIIVNMVYQDCFAGLFHQIGSPIIWYTSVPIPSASLELFGTYLPSSFVPMCVLKDVSAQLTFAQRTKNFLYNAYYYYMLEHMTRKPLESLYKEYLGTEAPSIKEVYQKQTSLVLMNSHFTVTNPRPLLPNVIEVGGIHCEDAKPLPKDLLEFVEGAKDGFIVFSLGSIVQAKHMPESMRQAFVEAFRKLKQKVIWKWEADGGTPDLPSNVKLVKWLPQQDLLGHPKIKLFITHGGLLSTEEALWHGVPVLGMPVFADQDANMRQAEILGFGIKGEILDLTEPVLSENINKIINDPRYMKKAKELSAIFRDQPETPLERAVYWTEYVMRHRGAYHLRSSAVYLNMIQYFSLDVVAFLILVVISCSLLVYYLIKLIIRIIQSKFSTQKINRKAFLLSKAKSANKKRKHL